MDVRGSRSGVFKAASSTDSGNLHAMTAAKGVGDGQRLASGPSFDRGQGYHHDGAILESLRLYEITAKDEGLCLQI